MSSGLEYWKKCKVHLKENVLSYGVYQKWISPVLFLNEKEDEIVLGLPKNLSLEEFSLAYLGLIKNYFELKIAKSIQVKVKKIIRLRQKISVLPESEVITNTYLEPTFSFEQFVIGDHAKFVYKACYSIFENLKKPQFNPLFIYAKQGLGKTHLLQAIGNEMQIQDSSLKVRYVDCPLFHQDFVKALKDNKGSTFFEYYCKYVDVLLFDDIHFLASKWGTQEEFFHIFNILYQSKKQIVLTSVEPPKALNGIEERLVSRFQSGLMVDIQTPRQETREAIVQKKLEESNLTVENDAIVLIAESVKERIPLIGSVVKQMLMWSSSGRKLTLNVVCRIIESVVGKTNSKHLSIGEILKIVCDYLDVKESLVISKMRGNKKNVEARQIVMYLIYKKELATLQTIGKTFSNRDHSTVKKSIDAIQRKIEVDDFFGKKIETLIQKIDE